MVIEKNLIRIDIDASVMGRPHTAEIAILGDAREALEAIAAGVSGIRDGESHQRTSISAIGWLRAMLAKVLGGDP